MDKTITITKESMLALWNMIVDYFKSLPVDQLIAHMAVAAGLILIIAAVIIW